jgi:hypothetical protein
MRKSQDETWECLREVVYEKYHANIRREYVSHCDVTAESRSRSLLLSNGSEITFPLQRIVANESLPGNKLLNTKYFVAKDNT